MSLSRLAIAGIAVAAVAMSGLSFALGRYWASLEAARPPRLSLDTSVACEANSVSSLLTTASLLDEGHVADARDFLLIDIRAGARKLDAFSPYTRGQTKDLADQTLHEADAYLSKIRQAR